MREDNARIAFWLNAYNETLRAELDSHPRRGSLLLHRRLFRRTAVEVGGLSFSLDVIEHGILRGNARPPGALRRLLHAGDPRLAAAPSVVDPRIHFALNCGAVSCPPVRRYEEGTLDATLEAATSSYLEAESELDREARSLTLPGLMKLYRGDFGDGSDADLFDFAARHLPAAEAEWIEANPGGIKLRFARFNWKLVEDSDGSA